MQRFPRVWNNTDFFFFFNFLLAPPSHYNNWDCNNWQKGEYVQISIPSLILKEIERDWIIDMNWKDFPARMEIQEDKEKLGYENEIVY
jgi:hypothetical protein